MWHKILMFCNKKTYTLFLCGRIHYSRYRPSKLVLTVVSIYGNSSRDPLICSFFKEEIWLPLPISMETREGPTQNSDLDWPKEDTDYKQVLLHCCTKHYFCWNERKENIMIYKERTIFNLYMAFMILRNLIRL